MIERLLVTLILVLAGSGAFLAFRELHMRRASNPAAASGRPTLLYFRSDTCAPCVTQARQLSQLPEPVQRLIEIRKVDADADPATAGRYGVFTLPTTVLLARDGTVKHINYGVTDAGKLARQVESLL